MRKTCTAKTALGDFKVTIPENPLLSKQAVTSKGIPIPYTNLQLNPYPNTQLDLFYSDNLSFQRTAPSTWLTNCTDLSTQLDHQLKINVGCKILQFIQTMKIMKLLDHKTLWYTNIATSSRTRTNKVSGHIHLHACEIFSCAISVILYGP